MYAISAHVEHDVSLSDLQIAVIDLREVRHDATHDVSSGKLATRAGLLEHLTAYNYARNHRMVVLEGAVPKSSIVSATSLDNILDTFEDNTAFLVKLGQNCARLQRFRKHLPEGFASILQDILRKRTQDAPWRRRAQLEVQANASPSFYAFDLDREFGRLRADCQEGKLLLAACYNACHSLMAEPFTRCTGLQIALDELRGCWQNKPYTESESQRLVSIHLASAGFKLSLRCLVRVLWQDSQRLFFLHELESMAALDASWQEEDCTELAWRIKKQIPCCEWLLPEEEQIVFGGELDVTCRLRGQVNGKSHSYTQFAKATLFAVTEFSSCSFSAAMDLTSFHQGDVKLDALSITCIHDWPLTVTASTFMALYAEAKTAAEHGSLDAFLNKLSFFLLNAYHDVTTRTSNEGAVLVKILYLVAKSSDDFPSVLHIGDDVVEWPECSCKNLKALSHRISRLDEMIKDQESLKRCVKHLKLEKAQTERTLALAIQLATFLRSVGQSCDIAMIMWRRQGPLTSALPTVDLDYQVPALRDGDSGFSREDVTIPVSGQRVTQEGTIKDLEDKLALCWQKSQQAVEVETLDPRMEDLKRKRVTLRRAVRKLKALYEDDDRAPTPDERRQMEEKELQIEQLSQSIGQLETRSATRLFPLRRFGSSEAPCDGSKLAQPLGRLMMEELEESWHLHMQQQTSQQLSLLRRDTAWYEAILNDIRKRKETVWDALCAAMVSKDAGQVGLLHSLAHLSRLEPELTKQDVFRLTLLPDEAFQQALAVLRPNLNLINPLELRECILSYLCLSIYEHKLYRILALVRRLNVGDSGYIIDALLQELQCVRVWDVRQHPEWLLFEVQNRIMIRPRQYEVAERLCKGNHELLQLNMGEGKSKVILPMLLSAMAQMPAKGTSRSVNSRPLRVNVPSPLLATSEQHFRKVFSALLQRRVYVVPFNRDCRLSKQNLAALRYELQQCVQTGSMMLCAPEHRLSLELKWMDAVRQITTSDQPEEATALCSELQDLLDTPTCEVLDECDELLKVQYQIIYTDGSQVPVEASPEQWLVL